MSDIKDFADQLQQEVVSDMAESYFGKRKNIDTMLIAFEEMVQELRKQEEKVLRAAAVLRHLLLDTAGVTQFCEALSLGTLCVPQSEFLPVPSYHSLPFAFTKAGRYRLCVVSAYEHLRKQNDLYLNGQHYTDKQGRKRLTTHYLRIQDVCGQINAEIELVNNRMSPSGTLRYVKSMDPMRNEQSNIMGDVCMSEGCSIDSDLTFQPIEFDDYALRVVEELPSLDYVKSSIKSFCSDIYDSRQKDVLIAMESLFDNL